MKKFTVLNLLKKYERWVGRGDISFLSKQKEQEDVLVEVKKLIDAFEIAERKAKKSGGVSDHLDWNKTHMDGRELWHKLASYALNVIEPNSKGNSQLFDYLEAATKFEDLLYGLEEYYRDHTLHSLWVYLIGECLMREDLSNISNDLNWYLYNDIEGDEEKDKYSYPKELTEEAKRQAKEFADKVNEQKDAIWCMIALCHDLGYSLSKLSNLNSKVQDVLKFFDVPDFMRVGYTLDLEHQYLVSQFLELMAMDVRIVPRREDYGEIAKLKVKLKDEEFKKIIEEKLLVKCYRDDSTYWRLCRALEKKEHGILSAYLIYKVLGIFADTYVRGPAEEWGLDDEEVKYNIIRGDILFAIAQHQFDFAHLNQLGSLADMLILADELEEFSRLGRELLSRKYHDTAAETEIKFKSSAGIIEKPTHDKVTHIEIMYESKHITEYDFLHFFQRKVERLCRMYSLEQPIDPGLKNYCKIGSIKMNVNWTNPNNKSEKKNYYFLLSANPEKTRIKLPRSKKVKKSRENKIYPAKCYDDEMRVYHENTYIPLKKWLGIKKG